MPPTKAAAAYDAVLKSHQRRLNRLIDRGSVPQLRRLYDQALAEINRKLAKLGPKSEKFAAHQLRAYKAQVMQGQMRLAKRMTGHLAESGRIAQVEGLRGVIADVQNLEAAFTGAEVLLPIEEAAIFQGVLDDKESLLRHFTEKSTAIGAPVAAAIL